MHKTSAWPLSLVYGGLIVYASLYPFSGWRDQGIAPWAFVWSPLPRYWTAFDVESNVLGYAPMGFLLALSVLRRATRGGRPTVSEAVLGATVSCALLSFTMEALQSYLPARVPSNLDWGLNVLGACAGALAAGLLERVGAIARWSRFRVRWFVEDARGALVLLALWPMALLFPASVPMGLGQVFERLESALADWLQDTPFLDWLPVRDMELQPLVPAVEMLCVMLGVVIPCLLGYGVLSSMGRRVLFAPVIVGLGMAASMLSAALSWGPAHAWAWLTPSVTAGLVAGGGLTALLLPVPRRACWALLLLALAVHLSLLNQAPESAYFAQTLKTWEQGRFIRFHGVVQWLGWAWPYVTLVYVLLRVSRGEAKTRIGT